MSDLKLFEITGSPNSVKARIALGYKGLDYERLPLDLSSMPGDRSKVVALSRQPRTPVLQHGKTVVFDSGGILRYLEANFPDTKPIFTSDYEAFGEIERWELFSRNQLGDAVRMVFSQAFAPSADAQVIAKANALLGEATGVLEDRLSGREWLVGDHLTAADIVAGAPLYLSLLTPTHASSGPIAAFFQQHFNLPANRPLTKAWALRVMAYDPVLGKLA